MTDKELKDLIASFAISHEKSVEKANRDFALLKKQIAENGAQLTKRFTELQQKIPNVRKVLPLLQEL